MSLATLFKKADGILKKAIKKELKDQGHRNTGKLEQSIHSVAKVENGEVLLEGFASYYAKYINSGVPASSISFKQFPFYVDYFMSKGYSEKDAKRFAGATIKKAMTEGTPTNGSMRFSKNGRRRDFVQTVATQTDAQINKTVEDGLDIIINKVYLKTKSETI